MAWLQTLSFPWCSRIGIRLPLMGSDVSPKSKCDSASDKCCMLERGILKKNLASYSEDWLIELIDWLKIFYSYTIKTYWYSL